MAEDEASRSYAANAIYFFLATTFAGFFTTTFLAVLLEAFLEALAGFEAFAAAVFFFVVAVFFVVGAFFEATFLVAAFGFTADLAADFFAGLATFFTVVPDLADTFADLDFFAAGFFSAGANLYEPLTCTSLPASTAVRSALFKKWLAKLAFLADTILEIA